MFAILPLARRKAVAALELTPGDIVLEIGAGTGRNLPYLIGAIGVAGTVLAVDASPGMLEHARRLTRRQGWSNVQLIEQDAARLDIAAKVDAVLFSLSAAFRAASWALTVSAVAAPETPWTGSDVRICPCRRYAGRHGSGTV